jgi:hypothetical protein
MKAVFLLGTMSAALALGAPATFNKDIAPIVYQQCARCHRAGEAAPFPLISYEDVAKRGKLIAAVTASRYMPPWKAEPASYEYKDSRRLTDAQLAAIQAWVKVGMPRGEGVAPPVPKFPEGWQLGTPDLIVEMPKAFHVYAEGPDIYRNFVIPLDLKQDEWVQAVELRTSSRVVHHVLYFADTSGDARKMDTGDMNDAQGMRFTRGMIPMGGVAVGAQPHLLPNGLALNLPKGSDLVFQYHFHPSGKAEDEKSRIGLYFAKKAPEHTLTALQLPPVYGLFSNVKIPAGDKDFRVTDSYVLPVDVEAISVGAHAHYLGKTMKMTATLPNGEVKTLLNIKDWDFSWQDRYFFDHTVSLPKGTRIDGEVSWDNSEGNSRNPSNPPIAVKWGEESKDEMGSVSLQVYPRSEADLKTLTGDYRRHVGAVAMPRLMSDSELRKWVQERVGPVGLGGGQ